MSFASDVKDGLCSRVQTDAPPAEASSEKPYVGAPGACCDKAMLYGMLLFGRNFSASDISVQTENKNVAELMPELLSKLYGVTAGIKGAGSLPSGHSSYIVSVSDNIDIEKLYKSFGYSTKTVSLRINRANIENECCEHAFLKGVFLSCGTIVEPEKDYHLEFVSPHFKLAGDLASFLTERDFMPKTLMRKGNYVVYFKESSQIEDILTYMGAVEHSLRLMDIKIYKEIRNKINRVTNCETANIDKTVEAAAVQCAAIKKIMGMDIFDSLPDDLREIGLFRLENPEMSLREIAQNLRISRSGAYHRLRRLQDIADRIAGN